MFKELPENKSHDEKTKEILFFTSPTCGPCTLVEKHLLQAITKKGLPISVIKIDITRDPEIAEKYDIVICPTLVFRGFMKVCGWCDRAELEALVTNFVSAFEL